MTKLWERLKALFGNKNKKAANRKAKGARKAKGVKAAKAKAPKEKAETKAKAPQVKDRGAKEVKEVKVPGKAVKAKGDNEVPGDARLLALAAWAGGQVGDPRLVEIVSRRLAALRRHERTIGAYAGVCTRYADMLESMDPMGVANRLKAGWWDWAVSAGYAGDFVPPRSLRGRVMEEGGEE